MVRLAKSPSVPDPRRTSPAGRYRPAARARRNARFQLLRDHRPAGSTSFVPRSAFRSRAMSTHSPRPASPRLESIARKNVQAITPPIRSRPPSAAMPRSGRSSPRSSPRHTTMNGARVVDRLTQIPDPAPSGNPSPRLERPCHAFRAGACAVAPTGTRRSRRGRPGGDLLRQLGRVSSSSPGRTACFLDDGHATARQPTGCRDRCVGERSIIGSRRAPAASAARAPPAQGELRATGPSSGARKRHEDDPAPGRAELDRQQHCPDPGVVDDTPSFTGRWSRPAPARACPVGAPLVSGTTSSRCRSPAPLEPLRRQVHARGIAHSLSYHEWCSPACRPPRSC